MLSIDNSRKLLLSRINTIKKNRKTIIMIITASARTIMEPLPDYCSLQSNAIELRIDTVEAIIPQTFTLDETVKEYCETELIAPDKTGYWILPKGAYKITYLEKVALPPGEAAFIIPRSFFVRNGAMIASGLVDSGYGWTSDTEQTPQPLQNLLYITQGFLKIKKGTRVAQFVIMQSESTRALYEGEHWTREVKELVQ